jgi:hypothetical protein
VSREKRFLRRAEEFELVDGDNPAEVVPLQKHIDMVIEDRRRVSAEIEVAGAIA